MNMILKKRHIVLAALVLALGVAVYLNWAFSDAAKDFAVSGAGGDAGGKKYGDAQLVNGDVEDGAPTQTAISARREFPVRRLGMKL